MSNQLFNEVGLQAPSIGTPAASGATILQLINNTGVVKPKGITVIVDQASGASDTDFNTRYTEMINVLSSNATNAAANSQARIFGCCLETIADGASGLVLLRGSCLALIHHKTTTISTLSPALIAQAIAGISTGELFSSQDAGLGVHFKAVALYRGLTDVPAGAPLLRPVAFNGVEGFFSGEDA